MTSLKGDLRSIMGTPFGGVGHAVLIFSRVTRAAFNSDSVVLQLHDRIEMPEEADGKFRIDGLDPGPVRVELEGGTVHNHGWNIDLPDEGTWSLADLVDAQVDWSPAVIGRAEAAARDSRDHADRAEAAADRVGTAEQVGVWASEASSSASAADSARSGAVTARDAAQSARDAAEGHANRAATSEANAKTSETNAKQSETNAGDYAAVATTAATEAVDAMDSVADIIGAEYATHEYVDSQNWARGTVPASTSSINDLADGSWAVGSASLSTRLGLPVAGMGHLVKRSVFGGITAHWTPVLPNGGGTPETYVASTDAYGMWGEWITTVAPNSKHITSGTDWNTLIKPGFYHRRTVQDDLNAPANAPGSLLVTQSHHSSGSAVGQLYMAYGRFGIYYRGLSTLGVPSPWVRLDTHETDSPRRDAVVSAGLARRGHVIGTGGLGAVAFRFDHHLQQFGDKILPLLKQYRIPWSQAVNPGNVGQGNDTMSFEQLTAHVHETGGEIWNHGLTHSNFTTEAEADTELGSSLGTLQDAMPSVWIDSFAAYGSGSMMGLGGWDTPEKFWNTYGGRILLAQHAFVSGLYSGQVRPLGGAELIGTPYAPMDTLSVSQFKSRLGGARDSRGGITFMLHPSRLDESGYLTLAQFEEMLAYAAAERDAGRIRILSTAGRSMADTSAPDRTLLENADAGSVNVSKIRSVSTFANSTTSGVPHELEVWAKAEGDVTLNVSIGSPTNPVNISETFTLNGAAKRLSLVATPPLDATTQSVTITGTCTHTQIKYRPI